MKLYYVYILASASRVLYIGITSKFEQRLSEHRMHTYLNSFTARYNVTRLIYFEEYTRVEDAIAREKQLKGWRRSKKVRLIEQFNPEWADLAELSAPRPHRSLDSARDDSSAADAVSPDRQARGTRLADDGDAPNRQAVECRDALDDLAAGEMHPL